MPSFLTPYPPSFSRAARPQARSGSTSLSNYFSRFIRGCSSSAYLTDVTPPITPSCIKEHRSGAGDDSTGALAAPESRTSRSRQFRIIGDEDGYITDCESSPVFDVVGSRLEEAAPNVNTQRALKLMDKPIKTATEVLELLDEPLLTPSMPATTFKTATEDFELLDEPLSTPSMSAKKSSGRRRLSKTDPATMLCRT